MRFSDQESENEFSGSQTIRFEEEESKEILDSGSMVMLSTKRNEMKDLVPVDRRIMMSTNNRNKSLNEKGNWKGWGQTYLCESAVTDVFSVSDEVAKGFCVVFDSAKENCSMLLTKRRAKQYVFLTIRGYTCETILWLIVHTQPLSRDSHNAKLNVPPRHGNSIMTQT